MASCTRLAGWCRWCRPPGSRSATSSRSREHYAETLRRWVANLEDHWDEAVEEVGAARARVWRLYMAGSSVNFAAGRSQIHQVLATPVTPEGDSGMPLRPEFQLTRRQASWRAIVPVS